MASPQNNSPKKSKAYQKTSKDKDLQLSPKSVETLYFLPIISFNFAFFIFLGIANKPLSLPLCQNEIRKRKHHCQGCLLFLQAFVALSFRIPIMLIDSLLIE